MNKEDYIKYYIQGSDHYLIPKDVFIELFNEMESWKQDTQKYKEVIYKLRKICSKVPYDWAICGIDVVHNIENILKEVK